MNRYKGRCTQCGEALYDYDQNYSDGRMALCPKCFDDYCTDHKVIIHHCPACVENGNDDKFYEWKGLDRFIEDNPPDEGWVYKYSKGGSGHSYIMIDATHKTEWWVVWHVRDKDIIKELEERLPLWTSRKA